MATVLGQDQMDGPVAVGPSAGQHPGDGGRRCAEPVRILAGHLLDELQIGPDAGELRASADRRQLGVGEEEPRMFLPGQRRVGGDFHTADLHRFRGQRDARTHYENQ